MQVTTSGENYMKACNIFHMACVDRHMPCYIYVEYTHVLSKFSQQSTMNLFMCRTHFTNGPLEMSFKNHFFFISPKNVDKLYCNKRLRLMIAPSGHNSTLGCFLEVPRKICWSFIKPPSVHERVAMLLK